MGSRVSCRHDVHGVTLITFAQSSVHKVKPDAVEDYRKAA